MSPRLTTRINGRRVMLQLVPNGVQGSSWVGEYRENGKPVRHRDSVHANFVYPLSIAPNTAEGLGMVMNALATQPQ